MRRYFRAGDIGTELKEDNTPLTIADTEINSLVIERVKERFPEHGVIGEEASRNENAQLIWVVDPIDGTMPFSLGIPISTFSLALVDGRDGQAIIGVVYDPQLDELYSAVRGGGAFRNGNLLRTSSATELNNTYVSIIQGTVRGEKSLFRAGICSDLAQEQGAKVFCYYSAIYAAVRVATGDLASAVFGYGAPWDYAAVALIVAEAGGVATDINGGPRRSDKFADGFVISANQAVHAKILELIKMSQ